MSQQFISALIGAVVTGIGWVISYYLLMKKERTIRSEELSIKFLERQIEELYGPIFALINESQIVFDIAAQKVPSNNGSILQHQFSNEDSRVWRYFIENHFLPINKEIVLLLKTKMHLINAPKLPESYKAFLDHASQFETLHNLWKNTGIHADEIKGKGWPADFSKDIESTLNELRHLHEQQLLSSSRLKRQ